MDAAPAEAAAPAAAETVSLATARASRSRGVTDVHIHVQPQHLFKPEALALMRRGRTDSEGVAAIMNDPARLIEMMDRDGIERAALVNYVAPEVMNFSADVNEFVLRYAAHDRARLLPIGSVNPLHTSTPGDDVEALADRGIAGLKIHPPHMLFSPNAYRNDLRGLAEIYERAQLRHLPITIHTGTSVFPGARNHPYADPMAIDDVAVDFPELTLLLAHVGRPLYMDTCIFLARRHHNVWLELSGIPPAKLLDYLPRLEELATKSLWGTDWPGPGVKSPAANLAAFDALALSPEAKERILRENAALVFPQ